MLYQLILLLVRIQSHGSMPVAGKRGLSVCPGGRCGVLNTGFVFAFVTGKSTVMRRFI